MNFTLYEFYLPSGPGISILRNFYPPGIFIQRNFTLYEFSLPSGPGISIPRNFTLSSNIKDRFADSIPYHLNGLLGEIRLYFFTLNHSGDMV